MWMVSFGDHSNPQAFPPSALNEKFEIPFATIESVRAFLCLQNEALEITEAIEDQR